MGGRGTRGIKNSRSLINSSDVIREFESFYSNVRAKDNEEIFQESKEFKGNGEPVTIRITKIPPRNSVEYPVPAYKFEFFGKTSGLIFSGISNDATPTHPYVLRELIERFETKIKSYFDNKRDRR